jgi:hypothetical protein
VPASRADRSLLITTGAFVALAGLLVAGALWFATSRDADPGPAGPLTIGPEATLKAKISDNDSPLYFASPFADIDGFWLDIEDGRLVALVLDTPAPGKCTAKWKQPRLAYIDCEGNALSSAQLDRYEISIVRKTDERPRSVIVDLRKREPAPSG